MVDVGVVEVEEDVADRLDPDPAARWCRRSAGRRTRRRRSAVLSARTYGKVAPPSTDSEMRTSAALTGATSVPATSQVIACAVPPSTVVADAWEVTRNGPAPGASVTAVSALLTPPPPGVAVAGGQPEVHRPVVVEADPVRGGQELGVAVADLGRHVGAAAGRRRGSRGQAPVSAFVLPAGDLGQVGEHPRRVRGDRVLARRVVLQRVGGADDRRGAELAEQRAAGLDVADQRGPGGAAAGEPAAVVLLPQVRDRVAVGVGGAAGQRERRADRDRHGGGDGDHRGVVAGLLDDVAAVVDRTALGRLADEAGRTARRW